jgi:hypothetical protein
MMCYMPFRAGNDMKLFFGLAVFLWLASGAIGAWMLDDRDWAVIAKGPISLIKAINNAPSPYPSQA